MPLPAHALLTGRGPTCRTAAACPSCCSTCRRSTTRPGTAFWAGATGRPAAPGRQPTPTGPRSGSFADGWHVEIQRTGEGTPPRWHVDIETDDVPAEVARLEALGATRHRFVEAGGFWQLLDPAGLVFCVVGIQTGEEFERHAVTWP